MARVKLLRVFIPLLVPFLCPVHFLGLLSEFWRLTSNDCPPSSIDLSVHPRDGSKINDPRHSCRAQQDRENHLCDPSAMRDRANLARHESEESSADYAQCSVRGFLVALVSLTSLARSVSEQVFDLTRDIGPFHFAFRHGFGLLMADKCRN
jgi:hypothetical protein